MVEVYRVRVVGPLEPYTAGFAAELARLGYTLFSARGQLGLAAHLSRWLAGEGLGTAALTPAVVARFLVVRRAGGYTAYRSSKALSPLLGYLRGLGVAPLRWLRRRGVRSRYCWSGTAATWSASGGWGRRPPAVTSISFGRS